ncbi:MAG: hypothetical protein Q4F66_01790 [Clostridium sp.]|nr:hypothetical protein [Clostridium sp.]
MRGHLECFGDECFWIEDDPWLPWGDIYCLREGDELRLLSGENAGESVVFLNIGGSAKLIGSRFCVKCYDRLEVEWIRRGENNNDY